LAGLREPNRQVIWSYIEKMKPGQEVTLDVDAHLVETTKANAFYCHDGRKAFQPIEVEWAETGLVLAEEFRQGNVLAGKDINKENCLKMALPYGISVLSLISGRWEDKNYLSGRGAKQARLNRCITFWLANLPLESIPAPNTAPMLPG
jgi:hypothetical protein